MCRALTVGWGVGAGKKGVDSDRRVHRETHQLQQSPTPPPAVIPTGEPASQGESNGGTV